jgi:serine/threonine protein kinase
MLKEYIFNFIPTSLCKYNHIIIQNNKIKIIFPFKGQTLNQYNYTLPVIFDILKAVHFLHHNNISHGDIKPKNILVHKNDAILIDYGSICINHNDTYYNRCTLNYISPEECTQKKFYLSNDIWSLGCTIYEFYTKKIFLCDLIGKNVNSYKKLEYYFSIINQESINKLLDDNIDDSFILDLLKKFLVIDHTKRCKIIDIPFLNRFYPVKLKIEPDNFRNLFYQTIRTVYQTDDEHTFKYLYDIIIENKIISINKEHIKNLTKVICILPKIIYLMKSDITNNTFI